MILWHRMQLETLGLNVKNCASMLMNAQKHARDMCTSHSRPHEAITWKAVSHLCCDKLANLQWHGQALGSLHPYNLNLCRTVAKVDTHTAAEAMAFSLFKALKRVVQCALVSGMLIRIARRAVQWQYCETITNAKHNSA